MIKLVLITGLMTIDELSYSLADIAVFMQVEKRKRGIRMQLVVD